MVTRPTASVRSSGLYTALERLAVRQISPRFQSQDERIEIADLRHVGLSIRQIAHRLCRAPSTGVAGVAPQRDQESGIPSVRRPLYRDRASRPQPSATHREQRRTEEAWVAELLVQRWSPQQISRHLRLKFPEQSGMWLCHESIYQAVYQPGWGLLRPSRLAPHHRSPLRTGRDHRRAHQRTERRRPRFEHPMLD